ncbi:MAG: VOC family protein [Proteobacteria bacterium]|nr:VOC family protein [Pseudomonadota bacterium]
MKKWQWMSLVALVLAGVLGLAAIGIAMRPVPSGMAISGVLHVNINCSDFERSRAFYEKLGFRVLMEVEQDGTADVAKAVGLPPYKVKGALMALGDGSVIDLLEWQDPHDPSPPYAQLNHVGLARIAFATSDIEADIARLKADGVTFLSEEPAEVPDPLGGTTRFICFTDPDGTVLELIEMGTVMGWVQRLSQAAGDR